LTHDFAASNPSLGSVVVGARHVDQLAENLAALEVMEAITADQEAKLGDVFASQRPTSDQDRGRCSLGCCWAQRCSGSSGTDP
jgi:hypothetical protein